MATKKKFLVQSVQRMGYDGSWRAGRKWPSVSPTTVEVFDQDEDPVLEPGTVPPAHLQIGRKTFDALRADPTMRVLPEGDPMALAAQSDDIEFLRGEVVRLTAENASLKGGGGGGSVVVAGVPGSSPGNAGAENAGSAPTTRGSTVGPSVPVGSDQDKHGKGKGKSE
jgi:hypothetical protein